MLVKVPKIPSKYPKGSAPMLVKEPKRPPKYPMKMAHLIHACVPSVRSRREELRAGRVPSPLRGSHGGGLYKPNPVVDPALETAWFQTFNH
jgi:hypothetical protein